MGVCRVGILVEDGLIFVLGQRILLSLGENLPKKEAAALLEGAILGFDNGELEIANSIVVALHGDDDESVLSTDDNDSYAKVDVFLRESLRVVNDAVALGKNQQYWASNHAPLTAVLDPKG